MKKPDEESIHDTVSRMHRGDPDALQQLVRDHLPWIAARVRNRLSEEVRREGDTQDFVQEALLEVLRDGPRFAVDSPAAFRALLARIVENTLIDRQRYMHRARRDRRREQGLPTDSVLQLDLPAASTTSPSTHAERSEQQAWLRLALELLDPEDREVIRLRDWEERPFTAIGECLGIQEEAAQKRYRRALPRLAQKLELLRRGRWQDTLDRSPPAGPPAGSPTGSPPGSPAGK